MLTVRPGGDGRPSPTTVAVPRPTSTAPSYVVPRGITSDCSAPADADLRAFLATVPRTASVRFPGAGCYLVADELRLDDRVDFTLDGAGSTFRLRGPAESGTTVWRVRGGARVTVRDVRVVGANPYRGDLADGCSFGYSTEWQHGFSVDGTRGALLEDVAVRDVCGDFVEAQFDERVPFEARQPARDVVVRRGTFEGSGRMGLGLTDVDGFTLEHSSLSRVNMVAVDLELDYDGETGRRVRIVGNTFSAVRHAVFANAGAGDGSDVSDVVFTDNVQLGPPITCQPPVLVFGATSGPLRSGYTFARNRLTTYSNAFDLRRVASVSIFDNIVTWKPGGGCDTPDAGARAADVQGMTVLDNAFTGGRSVLHLTRATGVVAHGNRL